MDLLQEQMGQLKKKISSPQNYRNCKLGSLEAALRQRFDNPDVIAIGLTAVDSTNPAVA